MLFEASDCQADLGAVVGAGTVVLLVSLLSVPSLLSFFSSPSLFLPP